MIRSELYLFLKSIAREAGDIINDSYGKVQHRIEKSSFEFKTIIDDKVEDFLMNEIQKKYPDHGINSEESATIKSDAEYVWIIDPLDGTLNFTIGVTDLFAVSIAIAFHGIPIAGIIYAPIRGDFYFAAEGRGAYKNNIKMLPSNCKNIAEAIIAVEYGKTNRTQILPYQQKLLGVNGAYYTYVFCNATVPIAMTAEGKLNAYFALNLEVWEMAAGVIINREAGNIVSNCRGQDWQIGDSDILVSSAELHPKLVNFLF